MTKIIVLVLAILLDTVYCVTVLDSADALLTTLHHRT